MSRPSLCLVEPRGYLLRDLIEELKSRMDGDFGLSAFSTPRDFRVWAQRHPDDIAVVAAPLSLLGDPAGGIALMRTAREIAPESMRAVYSVEPGDQAVVDYLLDGLLHDYVVRRAPVAPGRPTAWTVQIVVQILALRTRWLRTTRGLIASAVAGAPGGSLDAAFLQRVLALWLDDFDEEERTQGVIRIEGDQRMSPSDVVDEVEDYLAGRAGPEGRGRAILEGLLLRVARGLTGSGG